MGLLNRIARRLGEAYAHTTTLPQRVAYKAGYTSEMARSSPEIVQSYVNSVARDAGSELGQSAVESASQRVQQPDVQRNIQDTVTYATKPAINSIIGSLGILFLLLFGGYLLYNFYNRG